MKYFIKYLNRRGKVTKFQVDKNLRRVQVTNFRNFQFTNFSNFVTFYKNLFPRSYLHKA